MVTTATSAKIGYREIRNVAQALDLSPKLCLGAGVENVETKLSKFFKSGTSFEFV